MGAGGPEFEATVLPQLSAGLTLARWLTRSDADAQDVLQEAYVRAHKYFVSYRGGDARGWFLAIVRNCAWAWLKQNRATESLMADDTPEAAQVGVASPEEQLVHRVEAARVNAEIEKLPLHFREVLVLRELEELSYREIADIAAVPIGTVMSRLSRARAMLLRALQETP